MSFGSLGQGKESEMYKLILKFVVFIAVISAISLGINSLGSKLIPQAESTEDSSFVIAVEPTIEDDSVEPVIEQDIETIQEFGNPLRIEISKVGVNLPVQFGTYDHESQTWTIEKYKAYFAELSDVPNGKDAHTVIYAHNQKSEFYNIKDLIVGDEIVVYTNDGYRLTYVMDSFEFVDPNWGGLFDVDFDNPHLTLITCSGGGDEYRRLVHASLVNVERS